MRVVKLRFFATHVKEPNCKHTN